MIIGGGTTGFTLANLLGEEHQIIIIEKDEEKAKDIADKTPALVVQGDGSDISLLKESGLAEVDELVTTADDKTNLMICQIAKSENIGRIISLVNEPKNEELFTKLGINRLVSVVGTNVTAIKRMLYQFENVRIIAQLGEGEMQIVEITVSDKSSLIGQETSLNKATISAIYRGGELIIPRKTTVIEKGDLLLVVVKTEDLSHITRIITGE